MTGPATQVEAAPPVEGAPVTQADDAVARLMQRMREKGDFPALSDSLVRIQRVANSDSVSLANLSDEILKDVALTNKLLRIVNSALYASAGAGNVTTVSRAAALIGFAGIRNMAMSLVLVDHMQDKDHAKHIQEEILRALMAGAVAEELSSVGRDGEEAFVGAMFMHLGRLLVQYYLPDEAQAIRDLLREPRSATPQASAASEDAAALRVLGLSFEELGLGVAKAWGLPDSLLRCMRRGAGEPPVKLAEKAEDRVRWLSLAAAEMTDALLDPDPKASRARTAEVAKRFRRALGREAPEFEVALQGARARVHGMAEAMSLRLPGESAARQRLLVVREQDAPLPEGAKPLPALGDASAGRADAPKPRDISPADAMAAGIQSITNSMVEDFQLDDVLRMILHTMQRALDFQRVLFCLRDARGETLVGKFGVGADAPACAARFRVVLAHSSDLFSAVCNKGVDTLISDATVANIAQRLPTWYRTAINAPAFLLLPLHFKGRPLGLIYADKSEPGSIELAERELAPLRTLRNQALMAFKQTG
jgi:eukaryotic-like serine/threonine-protein kinase